MTFARAMRAAAIVVAIAGLIDPACSAAVQERPTLALVLVESRSLALPRSPTRAVPGAAGGIEVTRRMSAERVMQTLSSRLASDFDIQPDFAASDAAAVVLVGDGPHPDTLSIRDGEIISSVDVSSTLTPNVRVVDVRTPSRVHAYGRAAVDVDLEATGLAGARSTIALRSGSLEVARTVHEWRTPSERASIRLVAPPAPTGMLKLRVEVAETPPEATTIDNDADVAIVVDDRPHRILFLDGRPSWATAFIRHAIETDPRFEIASRVQTSTAIVARSGTPRGQATAEGGFDSFDVAVVGGLEGLTASDIDGLDRFARVRGGSLVLVPDAAPGGRAAPLLGGIELDDLSLEQPVPVVMDAPDSGAAIRAAEALAVRVLAPADQALGALDVGGRARTIMVESPRGAGRLLFFGATDAWRYRGDADGGYATWWRTTLARLAEQSPARAVTTVEPHIATPGARVAVRLVLRGTELARPSAALPSTIDADRLAGAIVAPAIGAVIDRGSAGDARRVRLSPTSTIGEFEGEFEAPFEPGEHAIEVTLHDALTRTVQGAPEPPPSLIVREPFVVDPNRHGPQASRWNALHDIASSHGGVVVSPENLEPLVQHLRASVPASFHDARIHPMASGWWILPFVACVSAEWIARRKRGLL